MLTRQAARNGSRVGISFYAAARTGVFPFSGVHTVRRRKLMSFVPIVTERVARFLDIRRIADFTMIMNFAGGRTIRFYRFGFPSMRNVNNFAVLVLFAALLADVFCNLQACFTRRRSYRRNIRMSRRRNCFRIRITTPSTFMRDYTFVLASRFFYNVSII